MGKVGLNFTFSLTTNEIDFDEISWYPTRPTCCYNYGRNRRVQPVHVERATTEQSRVSLTTSDISRIQRARILRLLRKRASFREIFFADPRKKKTSRRDRMDLYKIRETEFPEKIEIDTSQYRNCFVRNCKIFAFPVDFNQR